MAGMVLHPRVPLDNGGHPRQCPQIGAEAVGPRTLAKQARDLFKLLGVELGLAAGPTGGA